MKQNKRKDSGKMEIGARIEIDIDCGNTPLQGDEKIWLEIKIEELLEEKALTIKKISIT